MPLRLNALLTSEKRKRREQSVCQSDHEGRSPVYIGVGTVLLILVIVLLIAFVF
jgi:hypothetical protein